MSRGTLALALLLAAGRGAADSSIPGPVPAAADRDADGDGVPDARDLCPEAPEDRDGFEDEDGCPDPDNDRDRIPDASDKCPNDPETYNGFEDEDGCPDRGQVIVTTCVYPIVDRVSFSVGSAAIEPSQVPIVRTIAATLSANPGIRQVEVRGHTDGREAARDHTRLDRRRAEAVVSFLVGAGVAPGRLRAVGYGSTRPMVPDRTVADRAKNRRVEFVIAERDDDPAAPAR